jgi:pimeloyl-ACP methyl ester carboxylesterase
MRQDRAVDGFRLAYERTGPAGGPAVLLLHGWPGDRTDYREVVPLLADQADVVVPDLRGFGQSDKHLVEPVRQYTAAAQARSLIGLIGELGLATPVVAGYDIGSRTAQAIARQRPDLVRALVIAPPLPGIGDRILQPAAQREFWYQAFHNLDVCTELIDGNPGAVREYLRHFWSHWSGPGYEPSDDDLDHLVSVYGPPGAFTASIAWYRAGAGSVAASLAERVPDPGDRLAVPTTVLWPSHDPLFPAQWSDRIGDFFSSASLTSLDGAGHFTPLERPHDFAAAILEAAAMAAGHSRDETIPADLADAIARDEQAWAAFAAMPRSHRREWVRWVEEAKKPETRARRIAKTVESLRAGQPASLLSLG